MGLFFTEAGANARKGSQATRAPRVRVNEAERKLLTCQQCPLNHAQLQHGKMAPTGAAHPTFYVLGEAPGENEDNEGQQFIGQAGEFLRGFIPDQYADAIRWNNTIRCRPTDGKKNRPPAYIEISCCSRLQVQDIEQTKPQVILGFGNVPLNWFMGEDSRSITNWRGRRVPVKIGTHTCWYYPMVHPSWVLRMQNNKKTGAAVSQMFARDMWRVFYEFETGLPEPLVENPADYMQGIETIVEYGRPGLQRIGKVLDFFHDKEHGIDIETDGLRPFRKNSRILTLAIGTYDRTVAFPWKHSEARWTPQEARSLGHMIGEYLVGPGKKWAHGAKFEQEWLHYEFGPDVLYKTQWGDTLGQAHCIDERPVKELDELTHLHFGFRLKNLSDVDTKRMEFEPLHKILPYNALDTKYTHALSVVQADILGVIDKADVYEFLNSATPSFVQMQRKGVVRNLPVINKLVVQYTKEADALTAKVLKNKDVAMYMASGAQFSPTSNEDLGAFFRDYMHFPNPKRTEEDADGKKKYSVDEEVLSQFDHPVAPLILELRTVNVNRNTFVIPLMEPGTHEHKGCGKHVHDDGLVHSSYSQYIAVSNRSACKEPNQQNYPRREHKEVRGIVAVPKGFKLVAFDYGQLEWREGAELCGDATMIDEIWEGQDIHGHWTDSIGAQFVAALLKANRKKVRDSIKQFWTFANLYGQTLSGLAWDLSQEFGVRITDRDLEPFFIAFWDLYPGLREYQEKLIATYNEFGYVENYLGFRRHEPCARNEIINHPFQGSAGQLVIDAQIRCAKFAYETDRPQLIPVMNIHDDLTFYFPDATIERDIEDAARIMCIGTFCKRVPMLVECSVAEHQWDQKEEIASFTVNRKFELIEK